jgi:hypothetical protein
MVPFRVAMGVKSGFVVCLADMVSGNIDEY